MKSILLSIEDMFSKITGKNYTKRFVALKKLQVKQIKAILGVGDLETLRNVAKASLVCMMAGADFIKTSTGKESINANLNNSLVMLRMIRDFYTKTGKKIGFKPAGGITTCLLYTSPSPRDAS